MTIFRHRGKSTTGPSTYSKFVAKWDTTQPGSANDTVVLPLVADGTYDFDIDWGDGNRDTISGHDQSEVTHQYSDTGIYTIQLVANDMVGWQFDDSGDDDKLVEIMEWGPLRFVSDDTNLFKGCSNLTLSTTSNPPFNADAAGMFQDCSSLTGTGGDILNWDVGSVTGMDFMLAGCTSLDADLSNWDVSAVKSAEGFMSGAGLSTMNYDRVLSGWSSQSVQSGVNISFGDTRYSKESGEVFRDLLTSASTGWNISDGGMIQLVIPRFVTTWDTRRTSDNSPSNTRVKLPLLNDGLYDFEVDWGDGSTDQITNASSGARTHNYSTPGVYTVSITGVISGWNSRADGPQDTDSEIKLTCIHEWDALKILHSDDMSPGKSESYNYTYIFYDTKSLTGIPSNFIANNNYEGNVEGWFSFATGLTLQNFATNPISGWDVSKATRMHGMFNASNIDADIGPWDVSNVNTMSSMFRRWLYTGGFNNGGSSSISGWDTSNVKYFNNMLERNTAFNQPIGYWDTSSAISIAYMFNYNDGFDQDLSNWNVTGLTSATNFMANSNGISTSNYDSTLIGWAPQNVQNGVSIHFGNSRYSAGSAASARATLVSKGWTITDGGQA